MTSVAILEHLRPDGDAVDFMGPARVTSVDGTRVVARRSDGREVEIEMALAMPYEPCQRDLLLLLGGRMGNYAVGVIEGNGKTRLAVHGDIDVHAMGGELNLRADEGVKVHGREVEIVSDKLKVVAGAAVHKVTSLYQHVRELWSVKAASAHVAVSGDLYQRSKNATILTEEVVTMNGKQIHLG